MTDGRQPPTKQTKKGSNDMRKEMKKENKRIQAANLQGYHARSEVGINYAFQGFEKNRYFTSDRTIECDENFRRKDGKALKGYGLEIETGFLLNGSSQAKAILSNILSTAIFPIFPNYLFKQQYDSTITGTECITQVMTKEFIRNNYKNFKTMWNDLFPMFGITTDDGRCGMHVNISVGCFGTTAKIQEDSVRKLYYIINRYYNLFKAAFYRNGATTWCQRMTYTNAKTMDVTVIASMGLTSRKVESRSDLSAVRKITLASVTRWRRSSSWSERSRLSPGNSVTTSFRFSVVATSTFSIV